MDLEDKQMLDRLLKLTEENNSMLRKIRGTQKTNQMFKAIYWVVILSVTFGAYYYVQPYLGSFGNLLGEANSSLKGLGVTIPGGSLLNK